MEADRPQICIIREAPNMKHTKKGTGEKVKKPKKGKGDSNPEGRCIQPYWPDAPPGSYWDQEACTYRDAQGNPINPG